MKDLYRGFTVSAVSYAVSLRSVHNGSPDFSLQSFEMFYDIDTYILIVRGKITEGNK